MTGQLKLLSLHQCDNRAAHVFRVAPGAYEVRCVVRGAGVVDQQEHADQDSATERALEWVRGARFN